MFETIGLGILLILGFALCFFGKRILETVAFLIGAIAGAALAMVLAPNLHQFVDQYLNAEQCLIIGIIIGAIIKDTRSSFRPGWFFGSSFISFTATIYPNSTKV